MLGLDRGTQELDVTPHVHWRAGLYSGMNFRPVLSHKDAELNLVGVSVAGWSACQSNG